MTTVRWLADYGPASGPPAARGPAIILPFPLSIPLKASQDPLEGAVNRMARTLWTEARHEPVRAIEGVAAVLRNTPDYLQPATRRAESQWGENQRAESQRAGRAWICPGDPMHAVCRRIARRALAGALADPTRGATRYHRADREPEWAGALSPCAHIGNLLFYS
jgi:hypothetical protein